MKKFVDNPSKIEIDGEEIEVIQDYSDLIKSVSKGNTVAHWESGDSLFPIIQDMEYCKVSSINKDDVIIGMCVLCVIEDVAPMIHRVVDIVERDNEKWFKIGDTLNNVYGWTTNVIGLAEHTNIFQTINRWTKFKISNENDLMYF